MLFGRFFDNNMDKFDGTARIYKKASNILEKPLNKGRNEVRNSFKRLPQESFALTKAAGFRAIPFS